MKIHFAALFRATSLDFVSAIASLGSQLVSIISFSAFSTSELVFWVQRFLRGPANGYAIIRKKQRKCWKNQFIEP